MRVPMSWLKEYVDISITAEELAERLTLAGLEVGSIAYIGVPQGKAPAGINVPPSDHLVWSDKIVLGAIREVKAHPNADKLVLAMVDFGAAEIEQVVTGAPNLYPYREKGLIDPPLFTALALEGAEVFDGHADTPTRMILKEKALRGIPNRSMVCSAKELGLSEEHDGIILLEDPKLPPGTLLVDVLGDVIFDIELTPNVARAYSILGVAREVAALTGVTMREPSFTVDATGAPIVGQVSVEIQDATLNPRFTMILIRDIDIRPSPGWMQRRLMAVGERPINNIVDITNYVMLETGQPLHAFDYDVLLSRSGGQPPKIVTRPAQAGERLTTLDGELRILESFNELVCDTAGILGLAGIKGGDESKIQPTTRHVLLEAAHWNYINIRKSMFTLKLSTEAGLRFSRGVHPEQTVRSLRRAAQLMHELGNGIISQGIIDEYPNPAPIITIDLPMVQVQRLIGVPIPLEDAAAILTRLQFTVSRDGDTLHVEVPDHRTDISAGPNGEIGIADLCEEIARIYGYDRLPNTLIDDMTPEQYRNDELEREEMARDLLATLGLHETINYRLTTPDAEARLNAPNMTPSMPDAFQYVTLANPISLDRVALRRTLLNGLLELVAANQNHSATQRLFEIGPIFLPKDGHLLPDEPRHLGIAMSGVRTVAAWQDSANGDKTQPPLDFYDLKGMAEMLFAGLHVDKITFRATQASAFHPGRCALIQHNQQMFGLIGEIHPQVRERYDLHQPVFALELNLDMLLSFVTTDFRVDSIPTQPAVYQDIALIVKDSTSAMAVKQVIETAGGDLLRAARLFDVYSGEPIPAGKKSLAYALTYQAPDRTLTDREVAKIQQQIIRAAERELGATLRG